jgi:hypothetical protein
MGRLLVSGVGDRKVIIVLYSSDGDVHFMELDVGLVRLHCYWHGIIVNEHLICLSSNHSEVQI